MTPLSSTPRPGAGCLLPVSARKRGLFFRDIRVAVPRRRSGMLRLYVGLLGMPGSFVLGIQQLRKIDVHEACALHEHASWGDLNPPRWQFKRSRGKTPPAAKVIARKRLDEVFHPLGTPGGQYAIRMRKGGSFQATSVRLRTASVYAVPNRLNVAGSAGR